MPANRLLMILFAVLALAGCASRPINERLTKYDPTAGYRPHLQMQKRANNDPQTLLILAFSGGGTRAAALSFGVLDELRRTEVDIGGQRRRLIDEVDLITGVSGGSFTALAYALHGDRLFSEYEQRFLKRDVQGALVQRAPSTRSTGGSTSAAAPGVRSSPRSTTTRSCSKARRTPT